MKTEATVLRLPDYDSLPADTFGDIPSLKNEYSARRPHSLYPKTAAVDWLVNEALELLGVSAYQLGKLLGHRSEEVLRRWRIGATRPCSLYLTRLLVLWRLHAHGYEVVKMSKVDWERGVIVWRDESFVPQNAEVAVAAD